ncbi:unnamed protein product [Notodromas monacha]|uniref:Metalloendopeptidase n=1 Tax=Notodromas monacha TaxID=399045 RepID=A0A7R9BRF1_9CRUS|nr:unnamed protein product [Notodromas monacha]CAG0920295.1 unnamed protein product [Notodromas monacha]
MLRKHKAKALLALLIHVSAQVRADDPSELMQNKTLYGGDMAGGLNVPVDVNATLDEPVITFIPNSGWRLWTEGIMYYEYDSTAGQVLIFILLANPLCKKWAPFPTKIVRNDAVLAAAIDEIHARTCLRVYPRNNTASIISYIVIKTDNTGCWSYVGMNTTGPQDLNLQTNGCWYKGTVIHELLHAFGFQHEHQRYDRDTYITVNMTNVNPDYTSAFTLIPQNQTKDVGIPYDVDSIMHYGAFAFGLKDNTTNKKLQTIIIKSGHSIMKILENLIKTLLALFIHVSTQVRSDDSLNKLMQNETLFGGDMAGGMGISEVEDNKDGQVMAFIPNPVWRLWTEGIMYYEYHSTAVRNDAVLSAAIDEIHARTCLRIYPRNNNANIKSYVVIKTDATGCWSYVGMNTRGSQDLNLQTDGCWYKGTVIHELLHAFGFQHEHQRYDRDDYITINTANVNPDYTRAFTVIPLNESTNVGSSYDLDSIMHYGAFAFGLRDNTTNKYLQTIIVKSNTTKLLLEPYARPNMSAGNFVLYRNQMV